MTPPSFASSHFLPSILMFDSFPSIFSSSCPLLSCSQNAFFLSSSTSAMPEWLYSFSILSHAATLSLFMSLSSGLGRTGLTFGLYGLVGLLQPKLFYASVIFKLFISPCILYLGIYLFLFFCLMYTRKMKKIPDLFQNGFQGCTTRLFKLLSFCPSFHALRNWSLILVWWFEILESRAFHFYSFRDRIERFAS